MEQCTLCDPARAPIIGESLSWQLVLSRNQNLLGNCFLVLRRHLEAVPQRTGCEWRELHEQMAPATEMLARAFEPDHFNYAFLQNLDRHVHLHVIPRYAAPRTFAGLTFEDRDYRAHYTVPAPAHHLTSEKYAALAVRLRQLLAEARAKR
ncbi:MAG: hypothetical protein R3272_10165 [Candidatus Promineifilaceae bacterium]|nr:hypothetical protein [Candidatus Promineifilaceae bacterium]